LLIQRLSTGMTKNSDINEELKGLNSSLGNLESSNPYSVPDGYFEGLANAILAKVKPGLSASEEIKLISPLLAGISKEIPYSVPENYFSSNIESLPAFYTEEESPVLAAIGKTMPFDVPIGYFANLEEAIVDKVDKPKAKVVPLFARRWMRVAVAAAITGIITLAGYNYYSDRPDTQVAANNIADSSQRQTAALHTEKRVDSELKKVSTNELETFIKNVEVPKNETVKNSAPKKEEVKQMLDDVTDKDLEAFLEQVPTADEELAVID